MNKIRFLILLCFIGQTWLLSAQITLQSCFDLAEKNNPQTQLLPLVKESETLQINALTKNNLPQASLSGQATWQSQVTGLKLDIPGVNIPTVSKDQYKATLDLTQNLWDGGLTKSQKMLATATYNADVKSIESNIYQTKEQIANLFFGVLLANKQLANTETIKNDLENQLKKQEANVQNGTSIKSNVMMLNARLIELKQQTREILSRRLYALKGLSILTGKDFPESTELEEPSKEIENIELIIDRPELKLYEAQKDLAEANKSLVRAKNLPKINLFATGGYGRPGLNFLSSDFTTYFIGGLVFKIPLSHLYTKSQDSDFQQININKAKIDKQRDGFLQNMQLKLASQKEDIAKFQDHIQEDLKLIEIRTYMKKTAEKRLENGVITVSDYISEVDSETLAKQNLSLHQVQLLQGIHNIKITIGKF
jgi:outer membrane protein TolC